MKLLVVAVLLLAACRGGKAPDRKDAGPRGSASAVSASVVPTLPRSEDGAAALRALDREIEQLASAAGSSSDAGARHARALLQLVSLRLQRAGIRGRLDDYQRAVEESARLVELAPQHEGARTSRVTALLLVHEFEAARAALEQLATAGYPTYLVPLEAALADATGDRERALAKREQVAKENPSPQSLTLWAATLAQAGRFDEATALVPKAAAGVRDNPPALLAWLLFQWGRIYELRGELATAREFFAAAHARMPGFVEATTHLAQAQLATGNGAAATQLVDAALAGAQPEDRHPELLALAVQLGRGELADEARAAWERYVAALPLAFADHAARFYLGVGRDPKRALELARINHKNRDTRDARALVVEAAVAAGDAAAACAVVDPLVSGGTRAQRFMAWRALSRCGRTADAERLARDLGIVQ